MEIISTPIPGLCVFQTELLSDHRGNFSKIFTLEDFQTMGFETEFSEEFVTRSNKGVIRGLHFQKPPMEVAKVVTCLNGIIWDVVLDLRINSPCYGQFFTIELAGRLGKHLYIPPGLAHGFQALENDSLVLYKTTKAYAPQLDCGILWNSVDIRWPLTNYSLSDRDKTFAKFEDFSSPFK